MVSAVRNNRCNQPNTMAFELIKLTYLLTCRGRRLPAVLSIELVVRDFRRKSSNVYILIFVRVFLDESSGRKSFIFSQVLIEILSK